MKALLLILTIGLLTSCQSSADKKPDKSDLIRVLVKKAGLIETPWTHDLLADKESYSYLLDIESSDSVFYGDIEGQIIGVLPDTNDYYAILFYGVGDDLYPGITTFDKSGNKIDNSTICICNCAGIVEDFDTCIDKVTINKSLQFEMYFKLVTTVESEDSIGLMIDVCNERRLVGYIDKSGKFVFSEEEVGDCNE